jgi:hypothetical protein
MTIERIYKLLIGITVVISVAIWFGAYTYVFLSEDTKTLLSYSGHGAMISMGGVISWAWFATFMTGILGMLLFKKAFRVLFIMVLLVNMGLLPFFGVLVATGFELMLSDITSILSGVILCLAYLPPLNSRFR